ncbi:PglL family O-oligosaccharyltransferase [Acidovorax sp. HMWF018]|uniref:PglL family O-oligosaccharyltransferase n=1 Tax=Acidovorax sp. HMWF018 TaxID=2056855 RepID=UPI0018EE6656|nr:O-antigen ligase family protein [Acidovorax sp. HMWF018]
MSSLLTSLLHLFGLLVFIASWLSYDHYRPWVNFHAEALAVLAIWFLAVSRATLAFSGKAPLAAPRRIGWLLIIAIIPWLQWLAGTALFAGDALLASLYVCALVLSVVVAYSYALDLEPADGLTAIFFAVWSVALISAAIGLLQWLELQEHFGMYVVQTDLGDRAMGNLGQPNQLATLLLMGMVSLAWIYERKLIGPIGLAAGVSFLTLVLVLTQSRAGMVSLLAIALYLVWKTKSHGMRLRPRHIAIWAACYLIVVQCLPWVHDALLMVDSRNMSLLRDNGRILIWKQVWAGVLQSPWIGYGWNQTPTAHAAGAVSFPGSLTYTNAHNAVLDLMAWVGIPIALLITLGCFFWIVSRLWSAVHVDSVLALSGLVPIVIHSMLEYPFAYAYFLVTGGLFIGIAEARHYVRTQNYIVSMRAFTLLLVIWAVVGCRVVYEYALVEEDFRVVRFENLRIGQTPSDYVPPQKIWLLSQLGTMLNASRIQPSRNMTAIEMEILRTASLRFAYGALGLRYAIALGLNGEPEAATYQMRIVRGMYGEYYYRAAVSVLRAMENEKYPELNAVLTNE